MRASLVELTFWDVKLRAPSEKVAASEPEDEDDVAGRSDSVGDLGIVTELVL